MTEIETGLDGVSLTVSPILPAPELSRREKEKAAVQTILSHLITQPFSLTHTPEGAPRLVFGNGQTAPHISVSHSRLLAAVALSRDIAIGIDIEQPRPRLNDIAPKFLAPGEQGGDTNRLLRLWTAKEAVFKAAGIPGLLITHIIVDTSSATASIASTQQTFSLKWIDYQDHLIALATPISQ
ncbi:MAG: 4'-phosphopantetheinyl transferase superfamily protein [Paramuribaculum sp.]|nr:4'-phosphopantetheinyl transferase superfamily protein [Paramuribaculum sp.]MDE6304905.1 4'-phosphopantetheinyl transferase superfamily protein [Paramuribaculum sp.]